jgi:RNA polymerase sigma-70 factor (ECF subfamily)
MRSDAEIKRLLLATAARGEGSAEAFEALYKACAPLLLGIAQRIVRRRELAEEVLHDGFTRIWGAAGRFDPLAEQPVAWMAAIVRNRALDLMASHDVSRVDSYDASDEGSGLDRLFDWAPSADDALDASRSARWLRDCLGELRPVERQALVLAYDRGMSHRDLAAHLAQPLGTVKTWVRRGLANLRACVEECMGAAR